METEEVKRTWHKPELRQNTINDVTQEGAGPGADALDGSASGRTTT